MLLFIQGNCSNGPLVLQLSNSDFACPNPLDRNSRAQIADRSHPAFCHDSHSLHNQAASRVPGLYENEVTCSYLSKDCMRWGRISLIPPHAGNAPRKEVFCDVRIIKCTNAKYRHYLILQGKSAPRIRPAKPCAMSSDRCPHFGFEREKSETLSEKYTSPIEPCGMNVAFLSFLPTTYNPESDSSMSKALTLWPGKITESFVR